MDDLSVLVLDEGALRRLDDWGGDKLKRELARLYVENARRRLDEIDDGLGDDDDLGAVELAAHSLKSSAANVGLMRVSGIADELEQAASRGDASAIPDLRERLHSAAEEGARALNTLLSDEGA